MLSKLIDKARGAWRSKTVWFNTFIGLVLYAIPFAQDALPALAPYVGEDRYKNMMLVVLVANTALRFITNRPLEHK